MRIAGMHPDAQRELIEAALWYEQERVGLGARFLDAIREGLRHVLETPLAWPKLSRRTRRFRLNRFPYALLYQVGGDEVYIIAVMHLHRRPGYWKTRERRS